MAVRWFRMSYSRNAMLRSLSAEGLVLDELTVAEGIRAMIAFARTFCPQHAELDATTASARAIDGGCELRLVRRMRRHDHPEAMLTLALTFNDQGRVVSRSLTQS